MTKVCNNEMIIKVIKVEEELFEKKEKDLWVGKKREREHHIMYYLMKKRRREVAVWGYRGRVGWFLRMRCRVGIGWCTKRALLSGGLSSSLQFLLLRSFFRTFLAAFSLRYVRTSKMCCRRHLSDSCQILGRILEYYLNKLTVSNLLFLLI